MESDLKKLYELVAQMNNKLDKLDNIERHLARVDQDIRDLRVIISDSRTTTVRPRYLTDLAEILHVVLVLSPYYEMDVLKFHRFLL